MSDSTPTLERSLRDRLLGAEKGARGNGLYAYANLFRDARAALDASGNDERWQPIETAPKRGNVLVAGCWPNESDIALRNVPWMNIGSCSDIGVYGDWDDDANPTHWQPLPEPPAAIARTQEQSDG